MEESFRLRGCGADGLLTLMQPFALLGCGCGVTDEEIYRQHRADLVRYATVLVGPGEAEDVVAAVVLRVLASQSFSELDDARPYLFRAVLNEARTVLRRRSRPLQVSEVVDLADKITSSEILAAVLRLPAQQRAATYLVYWADQSIADTSRLMGLRPGTVKRYLFLARRNLRGVLNEN